MGAAQTAPIAMSTELAFTIVDTGGNTLHFDQFAYERSVEAAHGDYHDANWLRFRITLHAIIKHSVHASMLTTELRDFAETLRAGLARTHETEAVFEPMEPYLKLRVSRTGRTVNARARLDLAPATGPVIEFNYECRPEEIEATIGAVSRVLEAFPERRL